MDQRLNLKEKTIKLLEENIEESLCDDGVSNGFLSGIRSTAYRRKNRYIGLHEN